MEDVPFCVDQSLERIFLLLALLGKPFEQLVGINGVVEMMGGGACAALQWDTRQSPRFVVESF
jgi:hypothetical protein